MSPLAEALDQGHGETAQLLIDKRADVCATNTRGETPLHFVACEGLVEMVGLLIDKGADVSASVNPPPSTLNPKP
jgi:ankyrin repeat protein